MNISAISSGTSLNNSINDSGVPCFTICNLSCEVYLSQYFIQFFEESPDGVSLFNNNRKIIRLDATELDVVLIKKMLQNNPGRGINRSDNPKVYEKEAFYKEYHALNNKMTTHFKFENQGILLQLISRFLSAKDFSTSKTQVTSPKILDTMSYVQLHLSETLRCLNWPEESIRIRIIFPNNF